MRYILKTEKYTPWICGDNSFVNYIPEGNHRNYRQAKDQYQKDMLFSQDPFTKHYNSRVASELVGKGIIAQEYNNGRFKAIICTDNNSGELVCFVVRTAFPDAHFKRFIKVLKEAGINIKKNVFTVLSYEIENTFTIDPLKPLPEDFTEEKQMELSAEFLTNLTV